MEHKFRAWDKLEKRMVRVNAIDFKNREFLEVECDDYVGIITCPKGKFPEHFELMQYTGLHDKHGKEDWIGDIVKAEVGGFTYYREIFQAESGAFCINLPTLGATGGEDAIMLITCEHENVGSVHENPELLKG